MRKILAWIIIGFAFTALLAFVLFGEKLDAVSIVGMLICAAGVLIVNRGGRAKPAASNVAASTLKD